MHYAGPIYAEVVGVFTVRLGVVTAEGEIDPGEATYAVVATLVLLSLGDCVVAVTLDGSFIVAAEKSCKPVV